MSRRRTLLSRLVSASQNSLFFQRHACRYALNFIMNRGEITQEFLALTYAILSKDTVTALRKAQYSFFQDHYTPKKPNDDFLEELEHALFIEDDCYTIDRKIKELRRTVPGARLQITNIVRTHLERELSRPPLRRPSTIDKKIELAGSLFGLSDAEKALLTFLLINSIYSPAEEFFLDQLKLNQATPNASMLSKIIGCDPFQLSKAVASNGMLKLSGFIESERYDHRTLTLNAKMADFLVATDSRTGPDTFFRETSYKDIITLDEFDVPDTQKKIAKALLSAGETCNILLYGSPGAGKTELARSLGKSAGKRVFFITEGDGEDISERKAAILAAKNSLSSKTSVIVVDEADRVLNTRDSFFLTGERMDKSWISHLLDSKKGTFIWITNHREHIEQSTLRRFDTSIEVKKMGPERKFVLWKKLARSARFSLLRDQHLQALAAKHDVTPAAISLALKAVKTIVSRQTRPEKAVELISAELVNHQKLLDEPPSKLNDINRKYSIELINTDQDISDCINAIRQFNGPAHRKRIETGATPNLCLLFYGPPGTGKTEFVKHLAKEAGKKLILKRASDLMSCWVGGTEKNYRQAFDEAEADGAILFLDEADTFFWDRNRANRSWEVAFVNELLTQMENFKGIFCASTNLLDNMDTAVMRRFAFKIKFDYQTSAQKEKAYRLLLAPYCDKALSDRIRQEIRAIKNLAVGDFKAVLQRASHMTSLTHEKLVEMLKLEAKMKDLHHKEPIGIGR